MPSTIEIHNGGFVRLVDCMGSDLKTVNAARVSFGRHKDVLDEADLKLISYLSDHEHTAPFRHNFLTFHVKAPIFVVRQWMKHRIASDFNELSGRYVRAEEDFFFPETFRSQSLSNKQGSDGPLDPADNELAHKIYTESVLESYNKYRRLLAVGVAKEQARCVLPLCLYSEFYWTASLQAVAHFLHLRLDGHAQSETRDYAAAIKELTLEQFPASLPALLR